VELAQLLGEPLEQVVAMELEQQLELVLGMAMEQLHQQ